MQKSVILKITVNEDSTSIRSVRGDNTIGCTELTLVGMQTQDGSRNRSQPFKVEKHIAHKHRKVVAPLREDRVAAFKTFQVAQVHGNQKSA
jgi:hypothetical protein